MDQSFIVVVLGILASTSANHVDEWGHSNWMVVGGVAMMF